MWTTIFFWNRKQRKWNHTKESPIVPKTKKTQCMLFWSCIHTHLNTNVGNKFIYITKHALMPHCTTKVYLFAQIIYIQLSVAAQVIQNLYTYIFIYTPISLTIADISLTAFSCMTELCFQFPLIWGRLRKRSRCVVKIKAGCQKMYSINLKLYK